MSITSTIKSWFDSPPERRDRRAGDQFPERRLSQRLKIYRLLEHNPSGLCCFEVETIMGLSHQTASARLHELEKTGRVYRRSIKRTTPLGGRARPYSVKLPTETP